MNPAQMKDGYAQRMVGGLLFLVALFAPAGSGLQQLAPFDISKVFVGLAALLIACWGALGLRRLPFPRAAKWFALFVVVHTLITYSVFCRHELAFGYIGQGVIGEGFIKMEEGRGLVVLRFFLFALLGCALAGLVTSLPRLQQVGLGYGLGLLLTQLVEGYTHYDAGQMEQRVAGGVLNPNAYGLTGLMVVFLCLACLAASRRNAWPMRAIFVLFVFSGCYAVVISGSRGAMVGLVCGVFALVWASSRQHAWRTSAVVIVLFALAAGGVFLLEDNVTRETFQQRVSVDRIHADRGAGRLDIWMDYLSAVKVYWLHGVGLARAREAIATTYSERWAVPHNNYLTIFVEFGAVGLILFVASLIQVYVRFRRTVGYLSAASVSAMIAWLVSGVFLDSFAVRDTWLVLGSLIGASSSLAARERPGIGQAEKLRSVGVRQ